MILANSFFFCARPKVLQERVLGYLIFRFRQQRSLCVVQLAVATTGQGSGRLLLRWAAQTARKANMENVQVSAGPFGDSDLARDCLRHGR